MLTILAWKGVQCRAQDANETNRLTLDAAIRRALENNAEIRVFQADIAIVRGYADSARTRQNPEVSFTPGLAQDSSETLFHGDFGLEQTFEWPGKRALRVAMADKNIHIRRLALEGFRSQLAVQIRRSYNSLAITRDALDLRKERVALCRTFLEAAQKRVDSAVAPEFESAKAEVELVAAKKELLQAQSECQTAQAVLNSLMGGEIAAPLTLANAPVIPVSATNDFYVKQMAMTENPTLKILEKESELAGLSVKSIQKSRLPDFRVGPQAEWTRNERIVGLGISLPLPLWDSKRGEIASATAGQQKVLAELETARRDVSLRVAIASMQLAATQESLALHTPQLIAKLNKSLTAASQSYSEGRMPLLLYLETQRAWFDTQNECFEARKKCFEALAELESALGVPLESPSQTTR